MQEIWGMKELYYVHCTLNRKKTRLFLINLFNPHAKLRWTYFAIL